MPKLRAGVLPRWRQELQDRLARLEGRKPRGIITVTDWVTLFLRHMEQVGYQPATVDSPICSECGSLMTRNGSCYKCENCGSTSGCS